MRLLTTRIPTGARDRGAASVLNENAARSRLPWEAAEAQLAAQHNRSVLLLRAKAAPRRDRDRGGTIKEKTGSPRGGGGDGATQRSGARSRSRLGAAIIAAREAACYLRELGTRWRRD